jgi:hypothetical protein
MSRSAYQMPVRTERIEHVMFGRTGVGLVRCRGVKALRVPRCTARGV